MKKFVVLTDSTSDIEKQYRDQYEIGYLKMGFRINEKDYEADLDWPKMKPDEYYTEMRKGSRSTTNQVATSEIEAKFDQALKAGFDVLYVACSSKLSTSYNYAKTLAEDIVSKYPGRKVVCFDSLRSNYAEAGIAMAAAKMALEGKDVEEVAKILEGEKLKYQTFATVGSLNWLKMAGRVKASSAFFGNLLGVKPIIVGDAKGNNYAFKKVKGRKTSLDELIAIVKERIENASEQTVYVEQANCPQDAEYVAKGIAEATGCKDVHICALGPIIGATCGPDTITINFYGKKMDIVGEE